ncbi:hypothetical protein IFM89_007349 [Coptis chinensis]|uniref:Reverse transcriptase domain-containing protein n=1 Tax=Coptis chinensis TaxID=261450 RepID=A0A835H2H5_9MAGN|nr:hypothetical protein IFM89_007349 [Coptis chinensis]
MACSSLLRHFEKKLAYTLDREKCCNLREVNIRQREVLQLKSVQEVVVSEDEKVDMGSSLVSSAWTLLYCQAQQTLNRQCVVLFFFPHLEIPTLAPSPPSPVSPQFPEPRKTNPANPPISNANQFSALAKLNDAEDGNNEEEQNAVIAAVEVNKDNSEGQQSGSTDTEEDYSGNEHDNSDALNVQPNLQIAENVEIQDTSDSPRHNQATRLALVAARIISKAQFGFISNRNSHHAIGLASEMINKLKEKRHGGNAAIKLDISQVFDTLDWR